MIRLRNAITSKFSMSSNVSEWHAGGMPPSEHADWVIDLGPGGGVNGGEIVAEGPPEEVVREPKSATGQYLAPLLARSSRASSRDPVTPADSKRAEGQPGAQPKPKTRSSKASRRRSPGLDPGVDEGSADQPDLIAAK
jgi:hypothetical protein